MKILLIYSPFCPPSVPPYSISYLKRFLNDNLKIEVKCLDLNARFHRRKYAKYYKEAKDKSKSIEEYGNILGMFEKETREDYAKNNKMVVAGDLPELFDEMLGEILKEKPDIAAFSFVYSSQSFYAEPLLAELKRRGITVIAGGPATTQKMQRENVFLKNEVELVKYLEENFKLEKKYKDQYIACNLPDFSDYDPEDYISREWIIPLKTCSTCFYKQCTFCTHYATVNYKEYDLEEICKAITLSKARYIYFIDEMISAKRLKEIADKLKPLKVKWLCQLRPTKELIPLFPELKDSGLQGVLWGVESANQRMLNLIRKGTKVEDVEKVLEASHNEKIKNIVFVMFGFPGETKEEIMNTFQFLKDNSKQIDLVCTSIFGLQKNSYIYKHPSEFGIKNIHCKGRTVLDEKITYEISQGVSQEEAKKIRKRHMHIIRKVNKLPKSFDYLKEQVLLAK
jgi:radical SAM superfamily enzyme YgiQ (UPF0313 family)